MALDLLARGLAASARNLAATAGDGALPALAQFSDLALRTIPPTALRVEAGSAEGRGSYQADALATAALAAAHPLFCKADAAGRFFRLLPDDAGLIPVACGGAVGFTAEPLAATVLADERPILAAAELYRHAIGAAGVRLDARRYAVRRLTLPAGTTYADAYNLYRTIPIESSSKWVSTHPEGTIIYRRKASGTQPDLIDREFTATGEAYRGGMFFIEGTPLASGDPGPDKHSFTLANIRIDGGLRQSMGLTFEILDKPIWQQNDFYTGNLTLIGKSGAIGFSSELVYTSAASAASAPLRTLTIEDTCVFGETGGSCLNANGITTKIGYCLCYNADIGIEGWTGDDGYLNATFRNITRGCSIQGGIANTDGGNYYLPRRVTPTRLPIGRIDVRLEYCASFTVGAWIQGRITAVDCFPSIGNSTVFQGGAEAFDVHVISIADKVDLVGAVEMVGHNSGAPQTRGGRVRIDMHRTKNAVAGGFNHTAGLYTYGSLGPEIDVEFGSIDGMTYPVAYAAPNFDNQPRIKGLTGHLSLNPPSESLQDIQAGAGGTLLNRPILALSCTTGAGGQYTMNLPTAGVQSGSEIILFNVTRNNVNPGAALRIPPANFNSGVALVLGGNYQSCRVIYNGAKWDVVQAPPPLTGAATYDPPSLALGASAPIQTVTVNGAALGDKVRASFSLNLAGATIRSWVSAANTVSYFFRNDGGANPLDLASGTVIVEVTP